MMARRWIATLAAVAVALLLGWWGRGRIGPGVVAPAARQAPAASEAAGPCPGGAQPLYWKAPMDPTYVRDAPGKSPMGMDLVPQCPDAGAVVPAGSIRIDPGTVQRIGVRTAPVERRTLSRTIRAVGRVAYDERRVAHVHTKVQGWVERLLIEYVGHEVERGQALLEIYSPELVATQEELLLAARYRAATDESPFEDVRAGGESLFEATRRRLELWDIRARDVDRLLRTGEIKKNLTLYAPSGGVVTELGVRAGMEVRPNENLYTIADLSAVWVLAEIYEFELPWVEIGQTGTVELSYLPGEHFSGPVTYIAPFLDPKTRTAQIRLELPNERGLLKPEMFGNILLQASPRADVIAIPSEAVIRSGRRSLVIVARDAGRFDPRDVELGMDSGDGWVEVTRGLSAGEQIVVSSHFLIDSESRLREAVQKLLSRPGDEAEAMLPDTSMDMPMSMEPGAEPPMHDHHDHAGHQE
jgi:multidrug efflux pump subunit AcrA (membrane-fusion protein)